MLLRRLRTSLVALFAALLVVALVQPAAQAATTRNLTLAASPGAAPAKSGVVLSGKLSPTPKGSAVTLQRLVGTKWVTARTTATTTAAGSYAGRVTLPSKPGTYAYRAIAATRGTLKAAISRTVRVAALRKVVVTIKATPVTPDAGTVVTFSGTVKPFVKNTKVSIQKQVGTKWVTATTAVLGATGTFSKGLTIKNSAAFRASVPRAGLNAAAVSSGAGVFANPVIATSSLPSGTVGAAYTTTLTNVGSVAGTWSAAPLPAGLTLTAATGVISGTPTAQETKQVLVGFTQAGSGQVAVAKALPLQIGAAVPPVINTLALPSGQVGVPYSKALAATGGPGTWTATGLPAGLAVNAGTGLISGTPTFVGASPVNNAVTLRFTNTVSGLFDEDVLNLTVNPPPPPVILTQSLPDVVVLVAYSAQLHVSGDVAGTWTQTGLPSGLTLNPATGEITGTVLALPGTANVTIGFSATSTGQAATPKQYVVTIGFGAPVPAVPAAGGAFSCRTNADRTLWCWGADESGQLGHGGSIDTNRTVLKPEQVGAATDWTGLTTSGNSLVSERHGCAIRGTAGYCWGSSKTDQLGSATGTGSSTSPVVIDGAHPWSQLSAGWTSTCGVTTNGQLYCWGGDLFGQLGIGGGGAQPVAAPTRVGTSSDWVQVSAGYNHTCAVKGDNSLWCWGFNFRGQLGNGGTDSSNVPVKVSSLGLWDSVAVNGNSQTCATRTNGTLWCWGFGGGGADVLTPAQVGVATNWTTVAMGASSSCATNALGEIWCWGANSSGQLGVGDTSPRSVPTKVGTDTSWTSVSVGDTHACAARTDGKIWCWGSNSKGQLGLNAGPGATPSSDVPVAVAG